MSEDAKIKRAMEALEEHFGSRIEFLFYQLLGLALFAILLPSLANQAWAQEKLRFGLSTKQSVHYYLPTIAAEEKGIWKQNGLQVEWSAFQGGNTLAGGLASRAVDLGTGTAPMAFQAASSLPILIVGELASQPDFSLWVTPRSGIKAQQDLKGSKVGVARFGGTEYAFAKAVLRALGLERQVRMIATGGITESLALLKTGGIDAVVLSPYQMKPLEIRGEVREFLSVSDFLPAEWTQFIVITTREFAKANPEVVRRGMNSLVQAIDSIRKNPAWSMKKMKDESGYSDQAAEILYKRITESFTKDGKVRQERLENVRKFLLEFEIVRKDKVPAVSDIIWRENVQ